MWRFDWPPRPFVEQKAVENHCVSVGGRGHSILKLKEKNKISALWKSEEDKTVPSLSFL